MSALDAAVQCNKIGHATVPEHDLESATEPCGWWNVILVFLVKVVFLLSRCYNQVWPQVNCVCAQSRVVENRVLHAKDFIHPCRNIPSAVDDRPAMLKLRQVVIVKNVGDGMESIQNELIQNDAFLGAFYFRGRYFHRCKCSFE